MNIADIRKAMLESGNNLYFTYNNKPSGVESTFHDGAPIFEAWCGEKTKTYTSFEALILDKIFDGKSLLELSSKTAFDFL